MKSPTKTQTTNLVHFIAQFRTVVRKVSVWSINDAIVQLVGRFKAVEECINYIIKMDHLPSPQKKQQSLTPPPNQIIARVSPPICEAQTVGIRGLETAHSLDPY